MPSAQDPLQPSRSEVNASDESSDDSDFAGSLSSSSSDSEAGGKRLKRKARDGDVDSGDEKVIEGGRKRKRRSKKDADEAEEGVGQRLRRRKAGGNGDQEKKTIQNAESATVDVDELWAQMNDTTRPTTARSQLDVRKDSSKPSEKGEDPSASDLPGQGANKQTEPSYDGNTNPANEKMVTIKRTYAFAGETITEEKVVPKSSAEARLYLQSQHTDSNPTIKPGTKPPFRRPKKRASMFEPSSEGLGQGFSPSNTNKGKGHKLNTIEKSKLDWAGYVDQQGMKEELDGAEKSKDGYLGKRDFLERVVAKRDDEILSAKKR